MIHVKYKLKHSELHGIGLFVDQSVNSGDVIYTASPLLDLNLSQEEFESLDQKEKDEVLWWGFYDQPSQKWHVDFDVSKFINHSDDATVAQHEDYEDAYLVATRDLSIGEELTQNYLEFETKEDLARRGIQV